MYARVTPADKIRIVKAWQRAGEIVSMTGDGVNDAPALKAADIGCAMGITGTDVAKGAADMTLTDDNFATIVTAVKEGRGIYDNIRKAVQFLLSCNLGEILTVFLAILLWRETPLMPIQLLWINLVTDSLPALALGMEPVEKDVMRRRPRAKTESLFAHGMGIRAGLQGMLIGLLSWSPTRSVPGFLHPAGGWFLRLPLRRPPPTTTSSSVRPWPLPCWPSPSSSTPSTSAPPTPFPGWVSTPTSIWSGPFSPPFS